MYKIILLCLLLISFIFIISFCQKIYEPMDISFNEISFNTIITSSTTSINDSLIGICGDLVSINNLYK